MILFILNYYYITYTTATELIPSTTFAKGHLNYKYYLAQYYKRRECYVNQCCC